MKDVKRRFRRFIDDLMYKIELTNYK